MGTRSERVSCTGSTAHTHRLNNVLSAAAARMCNWQDSKVVQVPYRQRLPCTLSPERFSHQSSSALLRFGVSVSSTNIISYLLYSSEPPFDRHDWIVHRPVPSDPQGPQTQVRYIIDYYSAPEDADGNPVFFLDVRPAVDSVGSVMQRVRGLFWGY